MAGQRKHGFEDAARAEGARIAAARAERVTLTFDESTFYSFDQTFGQADRLVLGTGRDDATPVDNFYFFELNDGEFAGNARQMTIDARALGGQMNGKDGLFEEVAAVSTAQVTAYTIRFLGGAGSDNVTSGVGGDTMLMGGGNDYVSLGGGDDIVRGGRGDDRIDARSGDLNAGDALDGGLGTDLLIVGDPGLVDADMVNFRSIEIIGIEGDGPLELGANAAAAGVDTLYVDAFYEGRLTVGAGFTGALTVAHSGGDPFSRFVFDASASSATITFDASYDAAGGGPTYIGGSGAEDTILISNGFSFPGSTLLGGNLRHVTGFEHVVVQDLGGDAGAYLILDTAAGDIASAVQTVDASALGAGKQFRLRASDASADLHVVSGAGEDHLATGSGDDRIAGGLGHDTMTGGAGRDVFVYRALGDSSGDRVDAVTDFASGEDTIDVTGLGADLPALRGAQISFFGNQAGGAGDDRLFAKTAGDGVLDAVFRTDTHTLWFDTDDDGKLGAGDLHLTLGGTQALTGADVLSGHVVI